MKRLRSRVPARVRHDGLKTGPIDFWSVFESAPDAYLLLAPDAPRFTMVAANAARLRVTMMRRDQVIGHPLFEVFPDNPDDPAATGQRNLLASLQEVMRTGKPHRMALQKYDIRTPDGRYETRYWEPLNSPVFDSGGKLIYLLHRVGEVTDRVRSGERLEQAESLLAQLRESEERYRLLVDMIPQHVWTTDASGYHSYFSRRWYEFTGATEEQTKGEGWLELLHPEDRERTLARWERSLRTGAPYTIEYRFRKADGQYCWFLGQAVPQRDATGAITRWFGTLTDISERKRIDREREALIAREREAAERVTTILESITDAFFAVDRGWRLTYVNREAERLIGRSREELVGRDFWREFAPAIGSTFENEYRRAMTERTTAEFQAFAPTIGIWVDVRVYPSADGLSVFFRDVTDAKRAADRLRESEGRFRALAENATAAIFVIDDMSTIEFVNPAVRHVFGYEHDDLIGHSLDILIPADKRAAHDAGVRRYLETGRRHISWEGVELPGLTKDGRIIPLEISMGEFERDGRHFFTGFARDISERKQAEEALRRSEERFRALANTIPQLAWIADEAGSIVWYNDRWYEYTGTNLEEVRGWGWQKFHHPEHVQRVVARIKHAFVSGEPWEDTFPLRGRNGQYRWFLSRATPIRDASGKVTRWFGTNTDVTDQMEAAAERERLLIAERDAREEAERRKEEVDRVTESRTRLMRGFSHDVKNPLGAADGYAQLLEDEILGGLSDRQLDSVRRIRKSIQTSLRLIGELLDLARAEAGQITVDCVRVNMSDLVRDAAEEIRGQATKNGLSLDVDVPDDLYATTDPDRARQVLSNLLSNAMKYTPHGGVTVEARIDAQINRLAVSVSDTGPGIPAEKQETIFQEFTRLDPSAKPGAGVGLAISRRIARLLGGDITVASEVGRGSKFTLWLPAA